MSILALSPVVLAAAASGQPNYRCTMLDRNYVAHEYSLAMNRDGTPVGLSGELFEDGTGHLRVERGRINEEAVFSDAAGNLQYLVTGFSADKVGKYVGLTIYGLAGQTVNPQVPLLSGMCTMPEGAARSDTSVPAAPEEIFENVDMKFVSDAGRFEKTSLDIDCKVLTFDGADEDLRFNLEINKPGSQHGAVSLHNLAGTFATRIGPERAYKGYYSQFNYADVEGIAPPQLKINSFLNSKGGTQKVTIVTMMTELPDGLLPMVRIEEKNGKIRRTLAAGFCKPVMQGVEFIEYSRK